MFACLLCLTGPMQACVCMLRGDCCLSRRRSHCMPPLPFLDLFLFPNEVAW